MKRENGRNWKIKYGIEWILALVLLITLLPIFLLIALLEKIQDGGDVFFVSSRIGKNGKTFSLYKFRGMIPGAKPIVTDQLKFITLPNDDRITRLGKILRLGFDELAQLINVVKGDMCIIGPRPNLQWEIKLYDERERKRLCVLPGITGLAQILDGRSLHIRDNYELDVRYVENSNLITDFLILIVTIPYSLGFTKFYIKWFKKYTHGIPCEKTISELSGKLSQVLSKNDVTL